MKFPLVGSRLLAAVPLRANDLIRRTRNCALWFKSARLKSWPARGTVKKSRALGGLLKTRQRITRRCPHINRGSRCPFLQDMPHDYIRDLDNELQQKVEAYLAQKSTLPPREESRPDRLTACEAEDRHPHTPPRERPLAHDANQHPAHIDDAANAELQEPESQRNPGSETSTLPLTPITELVGLLGRDG